MFFFNSVFNLTVYHVVLEAFFCLRFPDHLSGSQEGFSSHKGPLLSMGPSAWLVSLLRLCCLHKRKGSAWIEMFFNTDWSFGIGFEVYGLFSLLQGFNTLFKISGWFYWMNRHHSVIIISEDFSRVEWSSCPGTFGYSFIVFLTKDSKSSYR